MTVQCLKSSSGCLTCLLLRVTGEQVNLFEVARTSSIYFSLMNVERLLLHACKVCNSQHALLTNYGVGESSLRRGGHRRRRR